MEGLDLNGCDTVPHGGLKLVAVHLGLSQRPNSGERQQQLAKRICKDVMLNQSHNNSIIRTTLRCEDVRCKQNCSTDEPVSVPAENAAVRLVELMEREESLNCGFGSNLTMCGQVECDAGFMSSRTGLWTGVGALSGCRHPIRVAKSLHDHRNVKRPLSLVQPNLLVGQGARRWMVDHHPKLNTPSSHLISAGSLARYQKYKSAYDGANRDQLAGVAESLQGGTLEDQIDMRLDTVGAIAVDENDRFACAISSGGIMLKQKGRLGQACVPGAGCWASEWSAVTTTGVGELLTATLLAKEYDQMIETMREPFDPSDETLAELPANAQEICLGNLSRCKLVPPMQRLGGILAVDLLYSDQDYTKSGCQMINTFHLTGGHNGNSMCIGYMGCKDTDAQTLVLNKSAGSDAPIIKTIKLNT